MNQCILSAVKHLGSICTTVLFVAGNMPIVSKAEERIFITNRSVPPPVRVVFITLPKTLKDLLTC